MATQVSPGIRVSEIDKSLALAQQALTEGAIAGQFSWGPVELIRTVGSEEELVQQFWKPNTNTADYFFTAANFLAYSSALRVVRIVNATAARAASADASSSRVDAAVTFTVNTTSTFLVANANTTALFPGQKLLLSNGSANVTVTLSSVTNGTHAVMTSNGSAALSAANAYAYGVYVKNETHYDSTFADGTAGVGAWFAKYPGALGNSLKVEICDSANAYSYAPALATMNVTITSGNTTVVFGGNAASMVAVGDILRVGNNSIGLTVVQVTARPNNTTATVNTAPTVSYTANTFTREWKYARLFDGAPGTSAYVSDRGGSDDELHVVVVDTLGQFSGAANTVIEKYAFVSKAVDAKTTVGATNYYKEAINRKSPYVWWGAAPSGTSNWGLEASSRTFDRLNTVQSYTLSGGTDGATVARADLQRGYDVLKDEQAEYSFVLGASADSTLARYIIDNIVAPRKYAIGFFSPDKADVVNNVGDEVTQILNYRDALGSTSYAVLDSGWKYQYDKYNDVYRWVPLNGDVAGCCVRADQVAEAWFSPAGFSRGQIKNVVKLAFNPKQADRDDLYRYGVNPVVTFPGQGTVLFGDKTLQQKPSAFDRINVRRLFIALEKTIEMSAKQQLFEQNDELTRNAFVNLVEPYLRSVKGRRGISDYFIVCDETNNPPDAVDRNEFRADIYVKPIRSINFIQLNFVAVRSDVAFSEVVTNLN